MQQTPEIPELSIEPQVNPEPREVQQSAQMQNGLMGVQPKIKLHKVQEQQESADKVQQQKRKTQNEAITESEDEREENKFGNVQSKQTNQIKQVKLNQQIASNSQNLIKLNFEYQADPNNSVQQFQVHIYQVESRQSLSQNGQQRYQINFTKSETNIPIEYKGGEEQDQKDKKQKLHQLESTNSIIRPSEDDDFYVQYLQQKWAKRQQDQDQINQLITNLEKDYQLSQTVPNSVSRTNQPKQSHQQTASNHEKSSSIPKNKKTQFKLKKVQDKASSSATNLRSLLNTSNKLRSGKPSQNQSQFFDSKTNQLKPYKYTLLGKKHLLNIEASSNKSASKQSFNKNQINPNVQYEMSLGNAIETMSHILEDHCYNTSNHKKVSSDFPQKIEPKPQAPNKVRKIIKRSPYGILEIQVKDNRNNAKITNLRILKPKEMIRLKKIPNLVKGNKENLVQKSINRLNQKSTSQKQGNLGQSDPPLLNCNRR